MPLPRPLRLTFGLLTGSALVLGLTTSPAQAASRGQSDSSADVIVSDSDYNRYVYERTDIEYGETTTSSADTTVRFYLDNSTDDTTIGDYTRLARLRVETVVKKTRKKVKTSTTRYVLTYVTGSLDPLTLERITPDGPQTVDCADVYYESDQWDFYLSVDNSCLGSKLYRVQATLETHSVDLETSTTLADSVQIKPVAY